MYLLTYNNFHDLFQNRSFDSAHIKQTAIVSRGNRICQRKKWKKKKKEKKQMRVQLTRNNFATGPAADHFYPWRNVGRLEGRGGS